MYISFIRNKDNVIAVKANMQQDLFENTDNIDEVLNKYNFGLIIKAKIKEYSKKIENNNSFVENDNLKKDYLKLRKKVIEHNLLDLLHNSNKVYSGKKENTYLHVDKFIEDLNNKLKLIDFYLEIKNALINKEELDIKFDENENHSKKLKFINLCVINYENRDTFIEELVKQDEEYSVSQKQKKLI